MTIYELASEHLQDHGANEADTEAILLEFGSTHGRDIPWGDIVPSIPRKWTERIDAYATGWLTRRQCEAAELGAALTYGDE